MHFGKPVETFARTTDRPENLGEAGGGECVGEGVGMPAPGAGHGVIELVNTRVVGALAGDQDEASFSQSPKPRGQNLPNLLGFNMNETEPGNDPGTVLQRDLRRPCISVDK